MNFNTTKILLDEIQNYFKIDDIAISTENDIDSVTLIDKQNVHFEVYDNEIIVGYFTDHKHFEDYTSELSDGEPDYTHRAMAFLNQLFTLPLKRYDYYIANKLSRDKYCFIMPDGAEELIGGCWYGLVRFLNPFAKKKQVVSVLRFDKDRKCFEEYYD